MDRCLTCGGMVETTVLPERLEDLGGITVLLRNAFLVHRCASCGEELTEIPDSEALFRAAALARVMYPVQLRAREIRFLRSVLDLTQAQFAEAVGLDSAETISRWEKGVRGIGGYADKLVRYGVHALLHKLVPAAEYDPEEIAKMRIRQATDEEQLPPVVCERVIVKHDHKREDSWDALQLAA